ncbi:radical SAM/SPASM domain-containing protein [Rhizorhapis suberifaciens]|uniref:Radical SAM core domain-containing protein n=1 Tax=Rhizorhapis suberifaciens TaxID=13656 RepID=A0A840HYX9_9SPHN|nr:radical SAM protein [Rhizorhapis suberifaciens]MBB4642718.1 uncharacterized protein [Rhizorhapis suberifaciens]
MLKTPNMVRENIALVLSDETVERNVGSRTAVYHRRLGGLCLLDEAALATLHSFKGGRAIPAKWLEGDAESREAELVQQLEARQLLFREGQSSDRRQDETKPPRVTVIQLIMANACNFGCTYCFEGIQGREMSVESEVRKVESARLASPESIKIDLGDSMYASKERFEHQFDPKNRRMKPDDAVRYIDEALGVARAGGVNEVMIQFFGGEPLLNWPAVAAVLKRFGNGADDGMTIHYSTVTNGSLITEEIARTFSEYGVAVCVSFDSPDSPNRPLKDGSSSTPSVMRGFRYLQKFGNRVAINAALTSSTWDQFDNSIVDLAVDVGASEIGVVVDFDPTFYVSYDADQIGDRLWSVIEYGRQRGVVLTGYWHQIFQVLLGFDVVSQRGFKNCSAKGAQLSIEPNGSVFSCKAGSTLLGKIDAGADLLRAEPYLAHDKLRTENPPFCNGCEIEGFCAGLCLGPLEKKFGEIDMIEPAACDFYRDITRKHIAALQPFEVATFDLQHQPA